MRRRLALFAALSFAAVLTGCPFDGVGDEGRACTAIFASVSLPVVDARAAPVVPSSATVTRADGTSLVCPTETEQGGCVVPISGPGVGPPRIEGVNDGITVVRRGETIRVGARAGNLSGTADLVVGTDGCHVRKISGPDMLVLR